MSHSPFMSVTVTAQLCSDDTLLAAAMLIFSNCFGSSSTADTAKLVIFLSTEIWQQDLKQCEFFLLFGDVFCESREQNRQPNMVIFGMLIMQKIKSHKRAPPYEQVTFIRLKQTINNKFLQLREFGEANLQHL